MFKPPDRPNTGAQGLEKYQRREMIYALLASFVPASSAREAHQLVTMAFREVEKNPNNVAYSKQAMIVSPFIESQKVFLTGQNIYYQTSLKHIVLLGNNGAINIIRIGENMGLTFSPEQILKIKEKFPSEFSKPGADGKDVWGNPVAGAEVK